MTTRAPDDALFASQERLTEMWDDLQCLQTDLYIGHELAFYYLSPAWQEARRVVDLGTGNGCYLYHVARRFPEKQYVGVDNYEALLALGSRRYTGLPIEFVAQDLFDTSGAYDFAVLRFVVQHLNRTGELLTKLCDIVRPGGCALIIDAVDADRTFVPPAPRMSGLFETFSRTRATAGRRREFYGELLEAVAAGGQWRVADDRHIVVPSSLEVVGGILWQAYSRFADLLELVEGPEFLDFSALRDEWAKWGRLSSSYTQVGIRLILLSRL